MILANWVLQKLIFPFPSQSNQIRDLILIWRVCPISCLFCIACVERLKVTIPSGSGSGSCTDDPMRKKSQQHQCKTLRTGIGKDTRLVHHSCAEKQFQVICYFSLEKVKDMPSGNNCTFYLIAQPVYNQSTEYTQQGGLMSFKTSEVMIVVCLSLIELDTLIFLDLNFNIVLLVILYRQYCDIPTNRLVSA